jgi:hypothetical protein
MLTNNTINFLSNTFKDKYSHIALGTNNTPEAITDTSLVEEVIRESSENTIVTTSTLNDTVQFFKQFNITNATTFEEFGLLDAETEGNLFDRIVTPDVIVGNNQIINVQFNIITKEV